MKAATIKTIAQIAATVAIALCAVAGHADEPKKRPNPFMGEIGNKAVDKAQDDAIKAKAARMEQLSKETTLSRVGRDELLARLSKNPPPTAAEWDGLMAQKKRESEPRPAAK